MLQGKNPVVNTYTTKEKLLIPKVIKRSKNIKWHFC